MPGKRSGHFDVAAVFADVGQNAAVRNFASQTVDFRAQLAVKTMFITAISRIRDESFFFWLWSKFARHLSIGTRWSCERLRRFGFWGRGGLMRGRFLLQPRLHEPPRSLRHIKEAYTAATVSVLPCDFT